MNESSDLDLLFKLLFEGQNKNKCDFTFYFALYYSAKSIYLNKLTEDKVLEERFRMTDNHFFKYSNHHTGVEYVAYVDEEGSIFTFKSKLNEKPHKAITVEFFKDGGEVGLDYNARNTVATDNMVIMHMLPYVLDILEFDYFCNINEDAEFVEVEFTDETPVMQDIAQDFLGILTAAKAIDTTRIGVHMLYLTLENYLNDGSAFFDKGVANAILSKSVVLRLGERGSKYVVNFCYYIDTNDTVKYCWFKENIDDYRHEVPDNIYMYGIEKGNTVEYNGIEQMLYDSTNIKFNTLILCICKEISKAREDVYN